MVQGNDASPYVTANRPWLELYNTRVPRPRLKRKSLETPHQGKCEGAEDPEQHSVEEEPPELAPIQKLLDDEMLANVLQFLPTYGVAHAACVCTAWRRAAEVRARGNKALRRRIHALIGGLHLQRFSLHDSAPFCPL